MLLKILIDLDVITVALWEKEDERREIANRFLDKVKNKEFEIVTPFFLIERFLKWKYDELRNSINEFYIKNTDIFITDNNLSNKIDLLKIDDKKVLLALEKEDVKSEDALLVLVVSIFNLDYFVTFNRKHLGNKREVINRILKENGLKAIKIIGPERI